MVPRIDEKVFIDIMQLISCKEQSAPSLHPT